ncbi:ABC transporter permease [Pseudooceanicola sp. CBS1P-1]|uniref:ABC transporter permease subunit n=1 Tax=Pseudooceanicola albus TaxID=2692189 RepID=A0A6L7G8G2_9RHOB|nr:MULTISPECIES: ABC transporter permease [Pseudooceanicola]MBT9386306.1 ABC transporter permease [Pseudooceanicola endophyticus]MXN20355.1 ABC transporter permease subunit [Pseudooceanicola albus]
MSHFQRWALALTLPAGALMLAFYVYPILQVLGLSFSEPTPGLGNYAELVTNPAIRRVLWTTVQVTVPTTLITVTLSYIVALAMVQMAPGRRRLAMFLVLVPFWISVLVRAFAWITVLRRRGIVNSTLQDLGLIHKPLALIYNELGVVIGMVHYMMPFAILLLYANLSDIDQSVIRAARSLGARRWMIFSRVWLPLSLPGLLVAALFVVIFSFGFLVTPALLGAGRVLMVAEYISVQISNTLNWGVATALSTSLLVAVGLLVWLATRHPALRAALEGGRK